MIKKYNKEQKISAIFANIFFVLIVLFSIFLIVYALYKIFNHTEYVSLEFYFISIMSGAVIATLFSFGIKRLSNNFKVYLSVFVLITGFVVLGFETYLELYIEEKLPTQRVAKDETSNWISTFIKEQKKDIQFDTRTKLEVINDFKDSGIDAFPNISPSGFIGFNYINGFTSKKGKIYPLGSISNSETVYSNPDGKYVIGETDKYGFNNPKGKYKENKVDIMITGNQNVGYGEVKIDETLSSALDKINFTTISIASADSAPLIQLASIKEYAESLKPKILLWAYSLNDINNLSEELKSPLLRKYLNDNNFSQKLILRQEEINEVLLKYIQNEWKNERENNKKNLESASKKLIYTSLIRIMKLYNLRKSINLTPQTHAIKQKQLILEKNDRQKRKDLREKIYIKSKSNFKKILKKSKETISNWDGKMYFLYLPSFERYSITNKKNPNFNLEISTANDLDIPVIDIHKEVFALHPNPLSLFLLERPSHYSPEGYRLIAEVIKKRIKLDGYISIK